MMANGRVLANLWRSGNTGNIR